MAHRLAPMSVSDELWTALTAEAARQRRTAAGTVRVILEDALLPKPEPTLPDSGVPKGLPRLPRARVVPEPTVERGPWVHAWDPGPNGRCLHKANGIVCNMPKRNAAHE